MVLIIVNYKVNIVHLSLLTQIVIVTNNLLVFKLLGVMILFVSVFGSTREAITHLVDVFVRTLLSAFICLIKYSIFLHSENPY